MYAKYRWIPRFGTRPFSASCGTRTTCCSPSADASNNTFKLDHDKSATLAALDTLHVGHTQQQPLAIMNDNYP